MDGKASNVVVGYNMVKGSCLGAIFQAVAVVAMAPDCI